MTAASADANIEQILEAEALRRTSPRHLVDPPGDRVLAVREHRGPLKPGGTNSCRGREELKECVPRLGQQAAVARPPPSRRVAIWGRAPLPRALFRCHGARFWVGKEVETKPLSGGAAWIEIAAHGDRCEHTPRPRERGCSVGCASANVEVSVCDRLRQPAFPSCSIEQGVVETTERHCGKPGPGAPPSHPASPGSLVGLGANPRNQWGYTQIRATLTEEEKAAQPWRCLRRFQSGPPAPGTHCPRADEPTTVTVATHRHCAERRGLRNVRHCALRCGCQKLDIDRGTQGRCTVHILVGNDALNLSDCERPHRYWTAGAKGRPQKEMVTAVDENVWTEGERRYSDGWGSFIRFVGEEKVCGEARSRHEPHAQRERQSARRRKFSWRGPSRH